MNYYEEKLIKIKQLIKSDKNKALRIINEELNMPYIPKKYESKFILLAEELDFHIKGDYKSPQLSKQEIIDYLFSNDKLKMASAIDYLRNVNVRTFLKDIEKWLFLNQKDSLGQAMIYEILVEQEINKEILFGDIKINPFKNGPIMEKMEIKNAFKNILDSNESPQIQESSIEELKFYILKTFPQFPKDGHLLAKELISIIKSLLENNHDFDGYKLDIYNIIKQK